MELYCIPTLVLMNMSRDDVRILQFMQKTAYHHVVLESEVTLSFIDLIATNNPASIATFLFILLSFMIQNVKNPDYQVIHEVQFMMQHS